MDFIWYILIGLVGGIIGGMGMGGGTLTIPLLVIFGGVEQHLSQSINLIIFLPMAIIALIIHSKNKLVNYKKSLIIILPAIATSILGAILCQNIDSAILKVCFGIFLAVLGVAQFISIFVNNKKEKKICFNKCNKKLLKNNTNLFN